MEYFLQHIAKHLYSEFANNLNRHCIVFPGRRAGLFFLKYLAAEIKQPVWTPATVTINDLFRSMSPLKPAENEILLFELYKVYRSVSRSNESFDDFFFWGDMLLDDFDDVDKYLGDASHIFRNIRDIKEIDRQFGGLTPEQAEIIRRFWVNFNPDKLTDQKTEFRNIWSVMYDLYTRFRNALTAKGLGYEGMIFRDVIENQRITNPDDDRFIMYHFAGFNALNECEKALMLRLQKEGRARFYWDYDNSFMIRTRLNSAGYFMLRNIEVFGNDMPGDWNYDTLLSSHNPEVVRRIIDTSSDLAQVKLIPELVAQISGIVPENAHETAVILSDEKLLLPVLTSLPENVPGINITMGYPLRQTSVYTLIRQLIDLQRTSVIQDGITLFNHREVLGIINNSLISELISEKEKKISDEIVTRNLISIPATRFSSAGLLSSIFVKHESPAGISAYLKDILSGIATHKPSENDDLYEIKIRNEFIFRAILAVNRLESIAGDNEVKINLSTWFNLLERILKKQSVPFSGEPLSGIQIMGILETRTLDFKNLIILSVNEGILPALTSGSSFIPFSIREAFGLPSVNHRESVYAYHFYRLLQRAENVTFIFNSNPEGVQSGEMSRFLSQMNYDTLLRPVYQNLDFEIRNRHTISSCLERSEDHQERLLSRFVSAEKKKYLSPSAINTWLSCRMKFYYRYVCGLSEPRGVSEEIDPAVLGTLLHGTMNVLYNDFRGKNVTLKDIDRMLTSRETLSAKISGQIREAFRREDKTVLTGNELIVTEVLVTYVRRILEADKLYAPFTIIDLETPVRFEIDTGNGIFIKAGGNIDRVDIKGSLTRIVDYKTGSVADNIPSTGKLFEEDRKKDADGWLQTLLYCEGYLEREPGSRVRPAIYKVKKASGTDGSDILVINPKKGEGFEVVDYSAIRDEFLEGLNVTVKKIFRRDEPFIMTDDQWSKCNYCPFSQLCLRY